MTLWLILGCSVEGSLPPQGAEAEGLVLILHGSGDGPEDWPSELQTLLSETLEAPEDWDLVTYDWTQYADARLQAARRGQALGEELAVILSEERDYAALQLIAHSAGAHVADAIARAETAETTQLTLLDPFGGLGLWRWGYGRRHFGEGADYSDSYHHLDDGVPSTNAFPDHSHGFDLTPRTPEDWPEDEQHWWPVQAYLDSLGEGWGLDLSLALGKQERWERYPVGEASMLCLPE